MSIVNIEHAQKKKAMKFCLEQLEDLTTVQKLKNVLNPVIGKSFLGADSVPF